VDYGNARNAQRVCGVLFAGAPVAMSTWGHRAQAAQRAVVSREESEPEVLAQVASVGEFMLW
jgi:hypothetical protein